MAFKWIALLCLVSIAVAQVEDSVPIATAQVGSEPAASDLPQGPTQGQDSAAVNPGLPQEGPIADIVFTGGECAQKCMRLLGDLNEVADPKNIEKVIKDLDGLCERYQNAKQCAAPCPQEELDSFNRATGLLQFTCVEKREMLQQLGPCMTQNQDSSLKTCEQQCGSLDDLIKVENGSGPTDPQQIFAKMGPVCK
uniref:Chondroitin proteoglycan 4 domain-containing protein n=1 Tax=Plectus sambesii TaxID=2011161 RepID=A0A914WN17_9BILA